SPRGTPRTGRTPRPGGRSSRRRPCKRVRRTRPRSGRAVSAGRGGRTARSQASSLGSVDRDGLAGEEPAVGGEDRHDQPADLGGGTDTPDGDAPFDAGSVVGVGEIV